MRPFSIFTLTLATTALIVALLTLAMWPLGLHGVLESALLAMILFPVTGVAWHRRIRRSFGPVAG